MAMLDLRDMLRITLVATVALVTSLAPDRLSQAAATDESGRGTPALSLVVEPGLACPDAVSLERELAAVVPLRFPTAGTEASGWSLSVDRGAGGVTIHLRDAGGATVLVRAVAVFPTRCEIAAQAIAIIVERHFRDLVVASDAPPAPVT